MHLLDGHSVDQVLSGQYILWLLCILITELETVITSRKQIFPIAFQITWSKDKVKHVVFLLSVVRSISYNPFTWKIPIETWFSDSPKMQWNHHCLWGFNAHGYRGVPYTHKFSSHKRLTNEWIVLHLMQQTSYPWINVPMNQQNFDNPQTLATTNKYNYDFTVVSRWTLSIFKQVYSKKSRSNLLSWSHVVYLVAILWPLPSLVQWLSPESRWSLLIFKSHSQISLNCWSLCFLAS